MSSVIVIVLLFYNISTTNVIAMIGSALSLMHILLHTGELEVLQMCDRGSSVADVAVPRIDLFQKQFITTEEHN